MEGGIRVREITCCFTGHRPDKLPWGDREQDPRCLVLKRRLAAVIRQVCDRGYRHFICGMAQGGDLYFAEAVLALRARCPDVTLEAALPCATQADAWPAWLRDRYRAILRQCDAETLLQEQYTPSCMHRRDQYMIQRSSLLIALYAGTPGGTAFTIREAINAGLEIIQLRPE